MKNKQKVFTQKSGIIAIIAVMAFSMASCAFMAEAFDATLGEMGRELTQTTSLIGTWRINETTTWTFDTDSTFTSRSGQNAPFTTTWATSGNTLTIGTGASATVVTYNVSGNTLTLQTADGSTTTLNR
jgi:hypothetical protein